MYFYRLFFIILVLCSAVIYSQGRAPAVEPVFSMEAEIQPKQPLNETSMMKVNFFEPQMKSIPHHSSEVNSNAVTYGVLFSFLFLPLILLMALSPKKAVVKAQNENEIQTHTPPHPNVTSLEAFREKKAEEVDTKESETDHDDTDKVA